MRKIIIVVDTARGWGRQFLHGVEKYMSTRGDWVVRIQPPGYINTTSRENSSWLALHDADGIIAGDIRFISEAMRLNIPKILHDARCDKIPGASTMYTDSISTGKMAAEYFFSLGFKNYAYCGFEGLVWSQKRLKGYKSQLGEWGITEVHDYNQWKPSGAGLDTERWNISEWLKTLPKPVCVFACNDDRGINVLEACQIAGIKVPEEVAVLGVDNDELMCDISFPPLSSIELNFRKAGFNAAKLLDEIIDNGNIGRDIIVPPISLIERQSSDVLAIEDENVIKALVFIRQNFQEAIQVSDVVEKTTSSRRDLEIKFKKMLKRSIKDEILRLRIDSLKKRLVSTNEPLYAIANSLKYTDPEHFSRFFKSAAGISPSKYRSKLGVQ
ncbi:MAG: substrate-binding domain-containing protein [Sedimentisphaeraceae bacterium JB056]